MSHQWYWPDWWKLWPTHTATYDTDYNIHFNVRCFGPLQWSYWDDRGTFASRSYVRGRNLAYNEIRTYGHAKAADRMWDTHPRDYGHPFDKGIMDVIDETRPK